MLLIAALMVVMLPVLVAAGVAGLFAQEAENACGGAGSVGQVNQPAGGGPLSAGLYAVPLGLAPGRWYEVGATEYGGPGDPTSGDYGSIPNPGESYLPSHPDSFAELSVLDSNPANTGGLHIRRRERAEQPSVSHRAARRSRRPRRLLLKARHWATDKDLASSSSTASPTALTCGGRPPGSFRSPRARSRFSLRRAPGQRQRSARSQRPPKPAAPAKRARACPVAEGAGSIPLPLTPGAQTKMLRSGLAAAGEEAPVRGEAHGGRRQPPVPRGLPLGRSARHAR